MAVLDLIEHENDVRRLPWDKVEQLPGEIRQFLLEHVSETGGHLSSNLGAVELTIALHRVLKFPRDKLIWDVGHQAYVHKILTGRKDVFSSLRQYRGISGFPKRCESACDCYDTGHSTTSISAGLGMAEAREIRGENYTVVSVIGDGSLTGGLAFEALNNASRLKSNFIIVLNDNEMSISRNIGGLAMHLSALRTSAHYQDLKTDMHSSLDKTKHGRKVARRISHAKNSVKQLVVPGMIFENMGLTYLGPVDGHDLRALVRMFYEAKKVQGAVVVHVITKKGHGYEYAEKHPDRFHGIGPFDLGTGEVKEKKTAPGYTDIFGRTLARLAARDENIVAVTAAMTEGTGLTEFRKRYKERFFNVGIAEEHAVVFAAGLALSGLKPVVAIYSSFLQRAYDELLEDVCLQKLPVVFAVDRAGIVGADGETHQGIFDLSYLTSMPHMTVMAPKNGRELRDMLVFAVEHADGPVAIRYPRGRASEVFDDRRDPIRLGKSERLRTGEDLAIFALGSMVETALKTVRLLQNAGIRAALINARFAAPLDGDAIREAAERFPLLVTMEENVLTGGFGSLVESYVMRSGLSCRVLPIGIADDFVPHGAPDVLKKACGIDEASAAEKITDCLKQIRAQSGQPEQPERSGKPEQSAQSGQPERSGQPEQSEQSERSGQSGQTEQSAQSGQKDGPDVLTDANGSGDEAEA